MPFWLKIQYVKLWYDGKYLFSVLESAYQNLFKELVFFYGTVSSFTNVITDNFYTWINNCYYIYCYQFVIFISDTYYQEIIIRWCVLPSNECLCMQSDISISVVAELCGSSVKSAWHNGYLSASPCRQGSVHRALPHPGSWWRVEPREFWQPI